jgi:DNA-binding MarR family transcriptional regulator
MDDLSGYADEIRAVLRAQQKLAQCIAGIGSEEWAQLDVSIGQLKTLMLLTSLPEATISQLAAHLGLGRPAASILVDRLVHLGLAQRAEDESDRRRTRVTLTPSGNGLVMRLLQGKIERYSRWLQALAPDDLAALRRGLEALAAVAAPFDTEPTAQHFAASPQG